MVVRSQRQAPAALHLAKETPVPILQEDGWVSGPVTTFAENLDPPPEFDTGHTSP